jgi:uncharacterized protein
VDDGGLQIHQYAAATLTTTLADGSRIGCEIDTRYPDEGRIAVRITEAPATRWTLSLRVPRWATGATLDGSPVEPGWARLHRRFSPGDVVVLDLPVHPRITAPDPRIDAIRGCVAVERGPIVLCAESVDLPGGVDLNALRVLPHAEERDGAVVVTGRTVQPPAHGWPYGTGIEPPATGTVDVPLRPYHRWARRGPSTMRVWLPLADGRTDQQ